MAPPQAPTAALTLQTASADQTYAAGVALGGLLQPGDFVGLVGELGAGKTQLVRGVAAGAGVDPGEVASPTFAIVYPYRGRIPLVHADLYRLADYDELYATGFLDLLEGSAALVEWLDRVPAAAPPQLLHLELKVDPQDPGRRTIVCTAHGDRPKALLEAWLAALP